MRIATILHAGGNANFGYSVQQQQSTNGKQWQPQQQQQQRLAGAFVQDGSQAGRC